ncbi:MAG: bacteriohemerythrin [Lentisphaerae bacterium]|jgi:hemerythrin|nr:bacteriohemerythrin [Lentisphaerota bacterium]MBT4816629.1 bacteriohemerythrin [Lentisphaerota bacterium]MBT5607079.1 bacteriohemerythrin [Lentisphaerota bacterium]MBT7057186.1 bacteriohemerythrin [Lentisphaerota bacterium]MBT7844509.1 bacteriohemerythrin [Lentisphaerota bacterium]
MKTFEWRDELNTGVELIDDQHQQYGRFVNGFLKAYGKSRLDQRKVEQTFRFLRAYVREHLGTEEALMKDYDYPHLADHLEQHGVLSDWVHEASVRLRKEAYSDAFAMEASSMLVDWFQTHIETVDKRLTRHLVNLAETHQDGRLRQLLKGLLKLSGS